MMKRTSILLGIVFLTCINLFAQVDLSSDTFMVVKAYQPTLIDAKKINFEPTIEDTLKMEHDLNYRFIPTEVSVKTDVEPISAARIKSEPLVKLYNGYAKLGFGNNFTPWSELYYHNLRSDEYSIGTHLKYSYFNGIDNIEHSDRSDAHFEVFGKRFWKQNTLKAALAYDFNKFNYYGFPEEFSDEAIDQADIDQKYDLITANFNVLSTIRDSFNLRHDVDFAYHYFADKQNVSEHNFKTTAKLSKIENTELYSLGVGFDYNSAQNLMDTSGSFIASVVPSIQTSGKMFSVKGGMAIYAQGSNTANFTFYPEIEITANVVDDILVPYFGVDGGILRNSYRSIATENNFVSDSIGLKNSNVKYNAYFGIRGTLSSRIAFNANFSQRKVDNFLMFVKDTTDMDFNKFTTLYDNVEEMKIKAELSYSVSNKLRMYLIGEYFGYNADKETEVWHRPNQRITLSTVYSLREKIIARVDLIYIGDQFAKGYTDTFADGARTVEKINLGGVFDANVSLEYRYTKKVSAFLNFNNIAGSSYEKWQDYRMQKFNFMGGFTYAF